MPRRLWSSYSFLAIATILIYCASNIKWGKDNWKTIIAYDAQGYYAYLPAIFLYQDLNYHFIETIEAKYYQEKISKNFEFRQQIEGVQLNKYFCGTALAQLPFFAAAHLFSGLFRYDQDGYSKLYMVFISLAAIFYLLLGLYYLRLLLLPLGLHPWKLTLLLAATVFGTPIFYYTVIEPGMSHVYSFAFVSMFLFYSQQDFFSPNRKHLLAMASLLGLIILIRPINGIAGLLIFFSAGSLASLQRGLKFLLSKPVAMVIGFAAFLLVISLQLIIYKATTGNWFVYSYGNEGFNFLHPHFTDILFSYRKGLFLYTPLFFISLPGFLFLWRQNRFKAFTLFSFLTMLIYLLSSWGTWWYGGSFSGRPFIEFTALFIFLLAVALKSIKNRLLHKSYVAIIIVLVLVCQFQTYQYRKGYIHWENMTKEQYWNVFLNPKKLLK